MYVQSITHQITTSSNFSAGYVFNSAAVIQNAFIDISDNVYSTIVYPLFQSQSTLQNLKIQFGTQTFNSGSLLLSSSSVSINQMNIISRPGSQLTVNSAQLLNILTSSSSSANVANLLVNLSFAPSRGNITLINNINSVFNVSGYQVLGTYTSTGSVAMLGLNLNSATVNINDASFKPTAFNVGTGSSYLFGYAGTTSTIHINNFAVILGSSTNFLLLASISTTDNYRNYYQFGGIMASFSSNSVLNVNNVILDSYQRFDTSYVGYSGFLVGSNEFYDKGRITIQNVCLQQNTMGSAQFNVFGLLGSNKGQTFIQNAFIAFTAQGELIEIFGIIGNQVGSSIYAEIVNSITQVNVISKIDGTKVGSLFGVESAKNCLVQNTSVAGGSIRSSFYVGGFIGYQYFSLNILNSSIQQTAISSEREVGGFIGIQYSGQVTFTNSKIQSVRILSVKNNSVGIIVGYVSGNVNFVSSSSADIYVNNVLRGNCAVLSNCNNGC
ncbi:Hypothetical_protein [Hexamita inflata]|uniref:Hypothetical_protein n=1 Tax=Hexamita inflata TaxID=28002 RepID=A0AA86QA98_9EUKA|nr:Hypothetical protein HINF_LOCUS42921 [Hexamita inflata]